MTEKEQQLVNFDSKAMIAKHSKPVNTVKDENGADVKVGTIIKYNERKKVEIIKPTGMKKPDGTIEYFYQIGQIINPHKVMAEELIAQGIAKEVKAA